LRSAALRRCRHGLGESPSGFGAALSSNFFLTGDSEVRAGFLTGF
jgi:hypothetical protein